MTSIAREVLARAAELSSRGEPYALATVVWRQAPTSSRAGDRALVTADGELFGWVGGSCSQPIVIKECQRALAEGTPRLLRLGPPDQLPEARAGEVVRPIGCASEGALEVFVEPHLPPTHLVIVGEAPVAETLGRLGRAMDFDVVRVEAEAGGTVALREADVSPASYVVVATMGRYDEAALEAALETPAGYVALVCSHKRATTVLETLRASGVSEENLGRVRAPAGLDLGPLRHQEIAVAILAEIVKLRAERAPRTNAETAKSVGEAAGGPPSSEVDAETEVGAHAEAAAPGEAIDPVCGMAVEIETARFTAERDGRTWYFCCDGCRRRFESEPARYVGAG